MKAEELRIGNLVQHEIGVCTVNMLRGEDIGLYDEALALLGTTLKRVSGIPLTEEWLIRFGFKREDKAPPTKEHSQYFSKWVMDYKYSFAYAPFREDWGFYHSYTDAPKDEDNDKFDFISCGLKYVHQLQNLYYALTSEELTLSPPQR